MAGQLSHPDRFLPRIRAELDKLPLCEPQKEQVALKILKHARFLDKDGRKHREDSVYFDFTSKIQAVANAFAADGLTAADYLSAALRHPPLFYQSPATIVANIRGVADHFSARGLTDKDYLRAALKQPDLFSRKPTTIIRHIELIFRLYGEGVFYLSPALRPPGCHPHASILTFLLNRPLILKIDDSNLLLRKRYREIIGGPPDLDLISPTRQQVERWLMLHLGHDDSALPVPKDANPVLIGLIRDGYLKNAHLAD